MHPAISVIFFTVTSGAGFGFIALIGLGMPLADSGWSAFFTALIAGILSVAGLLSSTFHLGHPERAWRAFSQWRSSWLSREGVLAVATLILFGIYSLVWIFLGYRAIFFGLLMAIGAVATVYSTAMIYAQLKTVPAWHSKLTPVCYLLYALASSLLLALALGAGKGAGWVVVAIIILALAWVAKWFWWQEANKSNQDMHGSSAETATGLGNIGKVRLLEKPHSGENYLTREMVHVIGRKHSEKLRRISLVLGAVIPLFVCLVILITGISHALLILAFVSMMAGLLAERWLFFAEAKHAVSLYYK